MSNHFLVLYPKNPAWAPASLAPLYEALESIGLLGVERSPGLHGAGPEYPSLVAHLGCSPLIALGDNETASTVGIQGIFDQPQFVHGDNLKPPRCPQCRKTLEKPAGSRSAGESLQCPHCGYDANLCGFDWRRSAACARVFVVISNVFESEAVPGERLVACLEEASGEAWDYCYLRRGGSPIFSRSTA